VTGDSGRGFSYPLVNLIRLGDRTGEACEIVNRGGRGPLTQCHVRPEGCYRSEWVTEGNSDVQVRPAGCNDPETLPPVCEYLLPNDPGVQCSSYPDYTPRPCLYDPVADQVVCAS
jgi:hypothetical protein